MPGFLLKQLQARLFRGAGVSPANNGCLKPMTGGMPPGRRRYDFKFLATSHFLEF